MSRFCAPKTLPQMLTVPESIFRPDIGTAFAFEGLPKSAF
jgi:hypothetical protein